MITIAFTTKKHEDDEDMISGVELMNTPSSWMDRWLYQPRVWILNIRCESVYFLRYPLSSVCVQRIDDEYST